MAFAFAPSAIRTIIDSARNWRIARDAGDPVQPSLYKRLERLGAGLLAPVLDSVLTLFEAGFRRRFRAGNLSDVKLTRDESRLLVMLDAGRATTIEGFDPNLTHAMLIALRSARLLLLSVIEEVIGGPSPGASPPIFFQGSGAIATPHPGLKRLDYIG
jgi:hypothetical protein